MNIAGRKIAALFRGPWHPWPGPEMPGLAGPVWYHCNVYLELDDGTILLVVPGDVYVEPTAPAAREALDVFDKTVSEAIGATVVDVLETDEPSVFVVLDGGRYLESTLNPGGTAVFFDTFATWPSDSLAECGRSVITHQDHAFREYVEPAQQGDEADKRAG